MPRGRSPPGSRRRSVLGLVARAEGRDPQVDLFLGIVLDDAVVFPELADEPSPVARDELEIVVGELRPFGLGLSGKTFPPSFDLSPIHRSLRCDVAPRRRR